MVLICIFLMISDVEHLFICLLASVCLIWKNIYSGFLIPKIKPCWPSKPNVLKACLPGAESPSLGSLVWASDLPLLEENLCSYNYSPFVGYPPGGVGFDCSMTLPLLPLSSLLFYSFGTRRVYSGSSGLFHQ